jgi:DtxR family transcriptional regulator, Mn-dependent transcriptional regulator
MEETTHLSLDETSPNDLFEVMRVLDHKELLTYMNQQNMRLHDRYTIIEKDPFTGLIKIQKDQETKTLSLKIAKMIFGQIVSS